ncbi:MAG TPA: vanadium-dependent haloperoxidase [Thermoanaerobaculia bacterium]|nr:vanadium-dependent haloperoxidase [Thermoanaerobaculia bacterium]
MSWRICRCAAGTVVALAFFLLPTVAGAQSFDFDTGNAAFEVTVPAVVPAFLEVSPGLNDATLVLRFTTLTTNAWFDAIAPYHPTAVGVYSHLGRRPPHERTDRNRNIALLYATYHVFNSLFPHRADDWRQMLLAVGLDPDDDRTNVSSPIGIGNRAGKAIVAAREHDGMNQLGDEGGRLYNRQPYADTTGYQPVNTAYELVDPSRWQPLLVPDRLGIFRIQQFVTPQLAVTRPYSYDDPSIFSSPPPVDSSPASPGYQTQADEVLAASAALTDHQKMSAEFFDNKIGSLGGVDFFLLADRGLSLEEFVFLDFLTQFAAFDAAIATWNEKTRHDAVRPVTAIGYLYGDAPVTAWGGPGRGTVSDLPANQWRSYLTTADHPEYPSGSTCFCTAHAQAARRFLGSDELGWSVPVPQGSSRVEPGVTPATDIVLEWSTWSEFEQQCGQSRLWGGVHFQAAIDAAHALCTSVADTAYEFIQWHIEGKRGPRP